MHKSQSIYVAGHRGMVGGALKRALEARGFDRIITADSSELDLRDQRAVNGFLGEHRPDYVLLAAAKVGGILANDSFRAEFIYDNLMIETNVIHAAWKTGVRKLLFLGSSCIYPKHAVQPMTEEALLSGILEPTNEPYAIAKIAGIKMCEAYRSQYGCNFISVMPTNLYGPGDNYDLETCHVLPALLRKVHEAKEAGVAQVVVWGTGNPRREFLHVDDLAEACIFLMQYYDDEQFVNVGTGTDISIRDLAAMIQGIVGYRGELVFDSSKPDGTPRKLLDVSRLRRLGWTHRIDLREGIARVAEEVQHTVLAG